jgi:replication-associated recombination protein RarA
MNKKELLTKDGYNMYDMASLMQKAIRRGDFHKAGFAGYQLYMSFYSFAWNRLLIISAEDCDGVITKEILALRESDQIINKNRKDGKETIFFTKAIMLLAKHPKSRDATYFACNFLNVANPIDDKDIEHVDISQFQIDEIPEYTYDCHTYKGTIKGKKIEDMVVDEQNALHPLQLGLFDNANWDGFYQRVASGEYGEKYARKSKLYKPKTQQ